VNDERNVERRLVRSRRQASTSRGRVLFSHPAENGRPLYNVQYFVDKAKLLRDMGADSICIKDQAGLISPYDAYDLVKALKAAVDIADRAPYPLHQRSGVECHI